MIEFRLEHAEALIRQSAGVTPLQQFLPLGIDDLPADVQGGFVSWRCRHVDQVVLLS